MLPRVECEARALPVPRSSAVPERVIVATPHLTQRAIGPHGESQRSHSSTWMLSVVRADQSPDEGRAREVAADEIQAWSLIYRLLPGRGGRTVIALGAAQLMRGLNLVTGSQWRGHQRPFWALGGDGPTCGVVVCGRARTEITEVENYLDARALTVESQENDMKKGEQSLQRVVRDTNYWCALHDRVRVAVWRILSTVGAHAPGCWALTAGGVGWSYWLRNFYTQQVYHTIDREASRIERMCLYGGRVECFRLGQISGGVTRLDRCLHYPTTARDTYLPIGPPEWRDGRMDELMYDMLNGISACAVVQVNCAQHTWPRRKDGRVEWVCGDYQTALCGAELLRGLQSGCVSHLGRTLVYTSGQPIKRVSESLISLIVSYRQSGDVVGAAFWKRAATGCYGRLIRRQTVWHHVDGVRPRVLWGEWREHRGKSGPARRYRSAGGYVSLDVGTAPGEHSACAVGAHLFSSARECMHALIIRSGPSNTYYLGVDAIHVNSAGRAALRSEISESGREPGKLRVECEGADADYRGLYDYRIGGTEAKPPVVSGAGRNHVIHLSPAGIGEPPVDEARYQSVEDTLLARAGPITRERYRGSIRVDGRVVPRRVHRGD